MNTQAKNVSNEVLESATFAVAFGDYYKHSQTIENAKDQRETCRKFLEPIIRAHKIPVGDNKAWKALQPEFNQAFLWLEWPRDGDKAKSENEITDKEYKQLKARVTAWLGVLRTCLEYQILPTDKNADRLRKAKIWTGLNGNGKMNPNWVDPKAPKVEPTPTATDTDEKKADAIVAAVERQIKKEDDEKMKQISAVGNALALATMQRGAATPMATTASVKPTTPQKTEGKVAPLHANVSSSDAPLSAREHFGVLFTQLLKNETFRGEYCEILAMMLEVDKATLTRCMVQARDEIK